ncbi:Protein YrdA [bioreactor metagenome]|uniref:Protein YrdA n=1 Tax=bioreactor metagenome TaxID=1076179 RepID=A0A644XC73_9ZZZZ
MKMKRQYTNGSVVIMEGAVVVGDVTLGEDCGVWFNTVIRGDNAPIRIGNRCCIEENCVLHCPPDIPTTIGDNVTIGHNAILHGCTVGSNTVIGMGAILMTGAKVGSDCVIGAGSIVTAKTPIPDGSVAVGNPAKIARAMTKKDIENNRASAQSYVESKEYYR